MPGNTGPVPFPVGSISERWFSRNSPLGRASGTSKHALARRLHASEPGVLDVKETVYALDSTTIDLCLASFPWAVFRKAKAAVKLHTLMDLRGSIPSFIHVSDGKMHD